VAESKRRESDAVDERLDEASDEAVDAFSDELDDELTADGEMDLDSDDDDEAGRPARRTKTVAKRAGKTAKTKVAEEKRPNIFARFGRFVREIVAELRKVIWPTRRELLTYTAVVVVFVSVLAALIFALDQGFARATLWVFGNSKK